MRRGEAAHVSARATLSGYRAWSRNRQHRHRGRALSRSRRRVRSTAGSSSSHPSAAARGTRRTRPSWAASRRAEQDRIRQRGRARERLLHRLRARHHNPRGAGRPRAPRQSPYRLPRSGFVTWKYQRERAALTWLAVDLNRTAMGLDNPLDESETDTDAANARTLGL